MKTIYLYTFLFFCSVCGYAQNLVPNPSFEDTTSCPYDGAIDHAIGWINAGGTPDYFNSCCSVNSPDFSVPNNWGGYQPAASGHGYSAVGTYEIIPPFTNVREFIMAELVSPLVVGNTYYISFKANLSLRDTMYFNLAANNIGALLSTIPYDVSNPAPINNFAHIHSASIISDTLGWTNITGSIIADSAYRYILIGNFFDDANTDTIMFKTDTYQTAYYFIDDVCVSTDSTLCSISVNTDNLSSVEPSLMVYPNPTSESLFINISDYTSYTYGSIQIINSLGSVCYLTQNLSNKNKIDVSQLSSGIYYISIQLGTKSYHKKVIIN